jgi:SAM-dependent methyltransferase
LYNRIIAGINKLGIELSELTLDDLLPVDEFHIRGKTATQELIKLAGFTSDMHILDVGCGVGGSARRLVDEVGCRVTGIDLSDEYIDAAEKLTRIFKMEERASFKAGSALQMPFADNSFDGAWTIQMGMNIEDKLSWLKEINRVVKPGGRVVFYEVHADKNIPAHYPTPWAQDSSMSFLVPPEEFHSIVKAADFVVEGWRDLTDLARLAFSGVGEPPAEPKLSPLGTHLLVGNDILTKIFNLKRNLFEHRVTLIETAAVKPRKQSAAVR